MNTNNSSIEKHAVCIGQFCSKTIAELVELFNSHIGLRVWASVLAYYV